MFAQNSSNEFTYRLTYVLDYKTDSTNINYTQQDIFYLYVNNRESKFVAKTKIQKDSIINQLIKDNNFATGLSMTNKPKVKNEYIIYNKDDEKLFIETIGTNNFGYKINELPIWNITNKKQKIEKFNCKEAIAKNYVGRNWTALFDNSHDLNVGPYKFSNLPGLVVKVYDDKNDYTFTLHKIEKITYTSAKSNEKYNLLDNREQILKLKRDLLENPFSNLPSGIKVNMDANQMREIINRNKKLNNNPLELK